MTRKKTVQTLLENRRIEFVTASLALVAVLIGGCSDHRISLAEFLQMQQNSEASPATQPASAELSVKALVDRQLGPYKVGPSDVLTVTLTAVDQPVPFTPIQVRVDRNGEINLPIVGAVKVADLELEDVESAIRKAYVPNVYRAASTHAAVTEAHSTNVLVTGAVTLPGLIKLRRTERNLLYAISAAGGASELASGSVTLRRLRNPDEEISLDLRDPEKLRAALALKPLEDGDIVNVEAATPNAIFVGGLVNAPSPQIYPQGVKMTILQAIAASGGLRTDIFPKEGTLIRHMSDGHDVHVKLNLNRIATGKDPNIALAAGDVLWVPHTLATRVQAWINQNIFLRAGASLNYNISGVEFLNRAGTQGGRTGGGGGLEDAFAPFTFISRNLALTP